MLYNHDSKADYKNTKNHGWKHVRTESSHWIFAKDGCDRPVPVLLHGNRDLGILGKRILKEAGIKEAD